MRDVSLFDLATGWGVDAAALILILLAGGLYVLGIRRLEERGRHWPATRTAAMAGALTAATLATQSGIGRYEPTHMWVHMTQHVLLGMAVPLLVVLSAPLTLALQTARPASRATLRRALHGRVAAVLANPIVGWCLFGGGLVALYLTPLLNLAARHDLVHLAVHAHIVGAGLLFLAPLVGVDPLPGRLSPPARLGVLLLALPFHTMVAMALSTARSPIAPTAYPLLEDQRAAAAMFWGTGEIFTLLAAAIVMRQWWTAEQRAMAREAAAMEIETGMVG